MPTAIFYILSNVCLHLPVPSLSSLSLCTLLSSIFCQMSLYISLYRLLILCLYAHSYLLNFVNWISCNHCTPLFSLSLRALLFTKFYFVFLYRMLKFLLVLRYFDLLCLQRCVQFLPSLPLTMCFVCVTMPNAVFNSLSTICNYFTLYRLGVLFHCVHCFVLFL